MDGVNASTKAKNSWLIGHQHCCQAIKIIKWYDKNKQTKEEREREGPKVGKKTLCKLNLFTYELNQRKKERKRLSGMPENGTLKIQTHRIHTHSHASTHTHTHTCIVNQLRHTFSLK